MAKPPERITIKRRRDEEPVETLCVYPLIPPFLDRGLIARIPDIEQKRIRSGFTWSRIDSHKPLNGGNASVPSPSSILHHSSGIPIVRSTFLTEERTINSLSNCLSNSSHLQKVEYISSDHRKEATHAPGVALEPSTPPKASQLNRKKSSPSKPKPQPRQFHLSRRIFSVLPRDSESNGRIRKRKQRRNDLPVFVEKPELAHRVALGVRESGVKSSRANVARSTPSLAKKANENLSEYSQNSIMLAWQLQELATKETLRSTPDLRGSSPHLQPKIKPKTPRPRPKEIEIKSVDSAGDQVMDDVIDIESEEDFVYDTYLRSSGQVVSKPKDMTEPRIREAGDIEDDRIGILVIEDADQEIWETFAEEEESDKEWNSDEEDENGMFGHAVQFAETRLLMILS